MTVRRSSTWCEQAFVIGMRYALLLGVGLLMVGALFVWFRGTSGTEDVLDDDLEREEDPILVS